MRLSRICIHNFRNFKEFDIKLGDRAVIVGDNKIGKSNLLHALRLLLDPSLPDSARQLRLEDFWDGLHRPLSKNDKIIVSIELLDFENDDNHLALLADYIVSPSPMTSRLTYIFQPRSILEGDPKCESDYEFIIFGGDSCDNIVRYEIRNRIPLDLLPALRDVESDLTNWRRSRLRPLLDECSSRIAVSDLNNITTEMSTLTRTLSENPEIRSLAGRITHKLRSIVGSYQVVEMALGFTPTNPEHLLHSLRLFIDGGRRGMGDASLGSANLIYITLKLLELDQLAKQNSRNHTFLAIEEPEAHLHPHLQRLIYRELLRPRTHLPVAGQIDQHETSSKTILLTTHSPHIVSVSPIKSLIILKKADNSDSTVGVSTLDLDISDEDIADLERYIDVTRGEIVFARGVILVEGDAERFIIPILSKLNGFDLDEFGITICSVSGTNFEPYIKLLGPKGMDKPFAVLTDFDPQSDKTGLGEKRVLKLLAIIEGESRLENGEYDQLKDMVRENGLFLNRHTFEVELFNCGQHRSICQAIMETSDNGAARERAARWNESPDNLNVEQFLKDIMEIGKGRFSQRLATRITDPSCPPYI